MRYRKCSYLLLSVLAAMCLLCGCGAAERIGYRFSGKGEQGWLEEAEEEGISPSAQEYYYQHLPEELREPYREIYVRLMRNEDESDFLSSVTVDGFWQSYYAVLADHPEIFWIGANAQIKEAGLTGNVVSYSLETTVPQEARASMRESLEAAADACIAQIPSEATDYEKIKYVYEWIIDTTQYGSDSLDSQNIQSVLLYRESVCAGYSKAFQYILNRMGLFCTYVTGTIKDGGDHGWNLVRLDDAYYYVDVTWGDPVFANAVDGAEGGVTNYNYLCCTEYDLFQTHTPSGEVELPPCTSDDYNYYKRNGYYYETFDYGTIYQALMESVWAGEDSIVMKFGSREAYDTAVYELFEGDLLRDPGQYLMESNGVTTWNYRYHTDEPFLLVTIYWT